MTLQPRSFELVIDRGVAAITLNRPERLNALTFEVYGELASTFRSLEKSAEARAVVLTGKGRGFCSGGDVEGIIAELFAKDARGLLEFTRVTGALIQSIRELRRPVIAAVNGVCVGAGAVIAAACDLRVASEKARFGFIFPKVGLSGADMGASFLLPRIVGHGRAAELLFFGDLIDAAEAHRIGFANRVVPEAEVLPTARGWADRLARGPAFAHTMTKQMMESEHALTMAQAIEAEAQAQAICMAHPDFRAAYEANKEKRPPRFEGAEICGEVEPPRGAPASALRLSCEDLAPFFGPAHTELAARLTVEALAPLAGLHDAALSARRMGALGLYAHLVPEVYGGAPAGRPGGEGSIDVRSLVLIREALGQVSPLADAIFAVQGLGSYPIALAGSDAQRARLLPEVIRGERIAAFGLTEPEAGSDVASLRTTARREAGGWVLDGEKTLISNVPIAHHYVVFANAEPAAGRKGISAFLVESDAPGLTAAPIPMSIPHPIGSLRLEGCRVPEDALLGAVGAGFKLAMETLDAFRISVGAAANGMAARALDCALDHVTRRRQFGAPLADQQLVKGYLADMATELDAARLLVARAAHLRDTGAGRVSTEAAMAKMFATEAAQRIIDHAVQLHGGLGVVEGSEVERLYREIRPLRIYEGTTEIQKLIIAKGLLDRRGGRGEKL